MAFEEMLLPDVWEKTSTSQNTCVITLLHSDVWLLSITEEAGHGGTVTESGLFGWHGLS
jgi:hypothetical protein